MVTCDQKEKVVSSRKVLLGIFEGMLRFWVGLSKFPSMSWPAAAGPGLYNQIVVNWDKTQKLKLWPNSKAQIVTKLSSDSCERSDRSDSFESSVSSKRKHFLFFSSLKSSQNTKTKIVTKLKNSNFDKTQTQIVTRLKNSNYDKTQKLKLWQNAKTQIAMKLKNTNCDKTQKLKIWQNSKTQIVTKHKHFNCDETLKHKSWKNSKTRMAKKNKTLKTQILTKLKNSNCDQSQKLKLLQNLKKKLWQT